MIKILLADDDPQFSQILAFQLKHLGYHIDNAFSIKQAMDYIKNNVYNLILLDIFFPNKDIGLQLLLDLKSNYYSSKTPIVLITAMTTQFFQQEMNVDKYLHYAKELISKTGPIKEFVARIKEIVEETSPGDARINS